MLQKVIKFCLLGFAMAVAANAGVLFTSPGANPLRFGDGFSLGTEFMVEDGGLQVTALGLFDTTGGGFLKSHDVGLWDHTAGDAEVASATIPAGTSATMVNGFRYVDIGPLPLIQGHVYVLGAFYPVGETPGTDDRLLDWHNPNGPSVNAVADPHFAAISAAFTHTGLSTSAGHLTEPDGFPGGTAYVGPNFEFTTIPEPGSVALLAVGLGALGLRRKGRRSH